MVQILAYVGGTSKNPYFASTSSNPIAQAAANGTLQPGPTTNYGPAAVISFGGNDVTLAPSTYSALGAGGGVITADQAYIQANSDVAAAIASGQFRNGLEHYLIYGAREGRFYAGVGQQTFSAEQLYLEENPDVAGAIQSGMFRSGLEHYLLNGASEGRYYYGQSTRSITPEELYLRDNQDVANAVRSGVYSSGLDHFNRYGRAEGRFYYGHSQGPAQNIFVQTVQTTRNGATITLTPDQQYLMANPAAAQAVASGRYRDGLQYFLNEGYASGSNYRNIQAWRLNNSAERSYLQAHADVAEAVAAGVSPSGEEHFFTYGKNEAFRGGYGQLSNATYNANTIDGAYLRANRDAALALANGQYATGLDYFLAVGAGRGQSYGKITAAGLNTVGERQYLAANRDVANAIAAGLYYSSGLEHFLATGYTEGRNYGNLTAASLTRGPSATLDRLYLQAHPEAAAALANGQFGSAFAYFATLGADRGDSYGRLTAATLGDANERNYLIRNKDVAAAVATGGYANGLDHFIYGGYAEGRGDYGNLRAASLTDPSLGSLEVAYLQQNKDVARAVAGGQYSSGLAHFLTVGGSEGRHYGALQASQSLGSSPEAVYIVQNADVAAAIAKGQASSGLDYFLKTGIDKGHSYGRLSAATLGGANDPERQYLTRFQDVAKAVADGVHASGLAHYLAYGYRDRLGINYGNLTAEMLNPNFLEGQYLQSHIGAANAVARGSAKNGIDYFLKTGIDQGDSYGKLSGASVGALGQAERAYLAQNLDVARNVAGSNGYTSGLVHYLTSGYVEANRTGYGALNSQTYKPGTAEFKYLLANQDAAQAVANGQYASGFDYFAAVGAGKGQAYVKLAGADFAAASPAERDYLLKNRDVANAVGLGVYPNGLDHFLRNGRTEGRSYGQLRAETLQGSTGSNPELAYLLANRDVAAAVAAGTYASGLAHYFSYGRAEGRQGYGTVSSEVLNATGLDSEYLRANPLALQAVASGQAKSGLDYFLKVGIDQGERYGRLTAASLAAVGPSERGYLSKNLDVAKAVAEGVYASGFDHYTAIGYTEANRGQYGALRTDFYAKNDAQGAYLRANKDAAKAVADGLAVTAMDYFLRTGVDKGQSFGSLSAASVGAAGSPERAYLTQHQDVAASVVAGTFASGLDHYLRSGYVDPRRASGYGRLNAQGTNPTFIFGSVDGKYLRANLDAAAAVAAGTAASGLDYFLSTGIQKGQSYGTLTTATVGSKDGAEYAYLKAHADVAQLVATGQAKSGLLYFLTSGVEQGHSYGAIAAGKLGGKTDPERKYLTRYLDVAAAVASGFYGSGLVHYLTGGKAEGRIYEGSAGATLQPVAIDPTSRDSWYLVSHDAAFMAVASGQAKNGLDYFLKVGIDKGDTYGMLTRDRFGDASSLERQYLARNLDVAAAVAEGTYINGLAHYLAYGYKEADRGGFGRLDPSKLGGSALGDAERKYLQANLDVGQAIADGRYQGDGLQHYLTWGYKEKGRGEYGAFNKDNLLNEKSGDAETGFLLRNLNVAAIVATGQGYNSGLSYYIKNIDNFSEDFGPVRNIIAKSLNSKSREFYSENPHAIFSPLAAARFAGIDFADNPDNTISFDGSDGNFTETNTKKGFVDVAIDAFNKLADWMDENRSKVFGGYNVSAAATAGVVVGEASLGFYGVDINGNLAFVDTATVGVGPGVKYGFGIDYTFGWDPNSIPGSSNNYYLGAGILGFTLGYSNGKLATINVSVGLQVGAAMTRSYTWVLGIVTDGFVSLQDLKNAVLNNPGKLPGVAATNINNYTYLVTEAGVSVVNGNLITTLTPEEAAARKSWANGMADRVRARAEQIEAGEKSLAEYGTENAPGYGGKDEGDKGRDAGLDKGTVGADPGDRSSGNSVDRGV
ncbi:hypothetical protein [Elstera cyanobacteriorum]|uniref:hypothetical protein n=1 Tax=Elstera cyanobacteriorum TaxID=2022747 RepID=UPI0023F0475C|nr:hypothetical protein [Elstera cyanobacteriorum]